MKIKLIKGMFKMEIGDISVTENAIVISSSENKREIPLADMENISVTRHTDRSTRFEINLSDEVIEGVFIERSDADEFTDCLKKCKDSVLQINFQGQ